VSQRRAVRNKLLEIVVTLAFLGIMLAFVLPWAADSLANGFLEHMRGP
jgi:hypothetical protein